MGKIKIGIPRSLFYYYYGNLWKAFFEKLGIRILLSPPTNKEIMRLGSEYATDEMCLSMKNYIGHVAYLQDKCDFILIPRIDNYGIANQTCTNFLATYDILHNLFSLPILHYNINIAKSETEEKAFIQLGKTLGFSKLECQNAYQYAKTKSEQIKDLQNQKNRQALNSKKEKILVVGHPYNILDDYIGKPILDLFEKMNIELIYSHLFPEHLTNRISQTLSRELYWKFNKENIGSIPLVQNKIDGIVFLSTFPCGPDSLVNELVIRKLKIPYLNLILDDLDSLSGFETRIESFVDLVKERKRKYA